MTIAENCDTCGRPKIKHDDHGETFESCSAFCLQTSPEEQARFRGGLKPDEWGVFPCAECFEAIEGEYNPTAICLGCRPKREARLRAELLRECLPFLPEELRTRVEENLK